MTNWNYITGSMCSDHGTGSCPHLLCLARCKQPSELVDSRFHLHQISPPLCAVWETFPVRAHPGLHQIKQQGQESYNPSRTCSPSEHQQTGAVLSSGWRCQAMNKLVNSEHLSTVFTSEEKYGEALLAYWVTCSPSRSSD